MVFQRKSRARTCTLMRARVYLCEQLFFVAWRRSVFAVPVSAFAVFGASGIVPVFGRLVVGAASSSRSGTFGFPRAIGSKLSAWIDVRFLQAALLVRTVL